MGRSALVISIEGLSTNMLGCYGGPWAPTPHLDRFASRATVFDQFWLDSCRIELFTRSLWHGLHALEPLKKESNWLSSHNWRSNPVWPEFDSTMVTDRAELIGLEEASPFREVFEIESLNDQATEDWSETHTAQFFEQALALWTERQEQALTWIHFRGWNSIWDAPMELRRKLMDEDDPDAWEGTDPPSMQVDSEVDPDYLFALTQAAAAQAILLDRVWEWVLAAAEPSVHPDRLIVLLGAGGFPLGEHGCVGPEGSLPYSERVHSPLIVLENSGQPLGLRNSSLFQTVHLSSALCRWMNSEPSTSRSRWTGLTIGSSKGEPDSHRRWRPAVCVTEHGMLLRTPAWGAIWPSNPMMESDELANPVPEDRTTEERVLVGRSEVESVQPSLFVHPEDRWQQNNVCGRATEVVESMTNYRDQWIQWCTSDDPMGDEPMLPDWLCEPPS